MLFAGSSNGFDLSPFDDFAPRILAASLNNVAHDVLSDDFELRRFDLRAKLFPMGNHPLAVTITKSGVAVGLVQWIHLDLDGANDYENRPSFGPHRESDWRNTLHRFPRPSANFGRSGGIGFRSLSIGDSGALANDKEFRHAPAQASNANITSTKLA